MVCIRASHFDGYIPSDAGRCHILGRHDPIGRDFPAGKSADGKVAAAKGHFPEYSPYTDAALWGDTIARKDLHAPGTMMGHDWIFDVLRDMRIYALSNDLPALAAKAEDALRVAEVEIAEKTRTGSVGVHPGNMRRH
jgi:hypothetical protein